MSDLKTTHAITTIRTGSQGKVTKFFSSRDCTNFEEFEQKFPEAATEIKLIQVNYQVIHSSLNYIPANCDLEPSNCQACQKGISCSSIEAKKYQHVIKITYYQS